MGCNNVSIWFSGFNNISINELVVWNTTGGGGMINNNVMNNNVMNNPMNNPMKNPMINIR